MLESGGGFHLLLQRIFSTRGSNPHLLHWQSELTAEPPGKPTCYCMNVKSLSRVWLFVIPWTVAHQAPQSMEFSRQVYWSGLPFPSPGDLSNPGIKHRSPALWADCLLSCSQYSLIIFCASVVSIVTSLSFLIFIWAFSLLFLVSLAIVLSILSFQRTKSLISLVF